MSDRMELTCGDGGPHDGHNWGINSHCPGISPKKDIAKWADKAMFVAEPSDAAAGPQVTLLWMTPDPLGAIAATCMMYEGRVIRSLSNVTDEERRHYFEQVQRTKLQAPFEFVKFHFLIEGVTRSFTHQMVRQRTAVYAQESLRFAVKEDIASAVALPPSLAVLPEDHSARVAWEQAVAATDEAYTALIGSGIPAEDARGLLPHNITTRLHYATDLRALLDHAGNRLCTQAQFEWRLVFARIVEAIREYRNPGWDPTDGPMYDYRWQFDMLSQIFKPVCYQIGKCAFKADFDRSCSIRDRVDANEGIGRPSSQWGQSLGLTGPEDIGTIRPEEWLLDPAAARQS